MKKERIILLVCGCVLFIISALVIHSLWHPSSLIFLMIIGAVGYLLGAGAIALANKEKFASFFKLNLPTDESKQAILLAVGMVSIAVILHMGSNRFMRQTVPEKMQMISAADSINLATAKTLITGTTSNHTQLKSQLATTQELKKYYLDMANTYFRNYYAFTICSVFFGTVLAIAAFLLVNIGWKDSKVFAKTFFLVTVFISSFYFVLANVLNNRENYTLNLNKVKAFHQIQLNILSFASEPYADRSDSLMNIVKRNYRDIATNYDLQTIEIDAEQLGGNPGETLKSVGGK